MNKIACVRGSGHGKSCTACVKAKQRCGGFLGEEKRAVTEPAVLGEVMPVLRDIVEVLRGIRAGMRGLEEAINGRWAPAESNKDESEGEEAEDAELIEELVGLSEEAADYRSTWSLGSPRSHTRVLRPPRSEVSEVGLDSE
jgi:hypothetical protein